jgi:hypothetical protein
VTTTSPTLSTTIERARIEQLPLDGRYIQNLVYMTTPGVEPLISGTDVTIQPRIYGLRFASELLQDSAVLENRDWASLRRAHRGSTRCRSSRWKLTTLRRR